MIRCAAAQHSARKPVGRSSGEPRMEKTIQYNVTTELLSASTAHVRRSSLVIRFVLACIVVAGIWACCRAASRGDAIAGWCLGGVSVIAAYVLICYQALLLKANSRNSKFEPIKTRVTFTDDGFAYHNAELETCVAWADVHRLRKTPVCWALHCMREGRDTCFVVPSEAVDGEVGRLIDGHTAKAQNH